MVACVTRTNYLSKTYGQRRVDPHTAQDYAIRRRADGFCFTRHCTAVGRYARARARERERQTDRCDRVRETRTQDTRVGYGTRVGNRLARERARRTMSWSHRTCRRSERNCCELRRRCRGRGRQCECLRVRACAYVCGPVAAAAERHSWNERASARTRVFYAAAAAVRYYNARWARRRVCAHLANSSCAARSVYAYRSSSFGLAAA